MKQEPLHRGKAKRKPALTTEIREALKDRAKGMCEVCAQDWGTNAHHRQNRSQGGGNTLSNLLWLCGSGTTGCHGWITNHPALSYQEGWSVRSTGCPAEVPVMRRGRLVLLSDDGGVTAHG